MPTTKRRSRLMGLMRASPVPLFLACALGGVLMAVSAAMRADNQIPDSAARAWKHLVWNAGETLLVVGGLLFIALLWGGVYLMVVEASRGMPGLREVTEPPMAPEPAAQGGKLKGALEGLGFEHSGWFSLDDFDETHVSAWGHGGRAAFVLYYPVGGMFRLRIVRRFTDGTILVSSTRLNDLAYPCPPGMYLQARHKATAEELCAWHLEAEKLFPAGDTRPLPKDLYVETSERRARHRRGDPTWMLAVEPVEECWRMCRLNGMPVKEQIERGWVKV